MSGLGTGLGQAIARARGALPARVSSTAARVIGATTAFVLTGAMILLGYAGCDCLLKQYDDSYITFRYAHNLASGNGLVFNIGDATDSASSFLYTLLLAGCHRLGVRNLPLVATALGIACAAGVSAIVFLACLERTRGPLVSLFLALAVGSHGLVSGWSVSGMETLFFTFLVTLTTFRIFIQCALGWLEAALVLACMLTRYEGILLCVAWFTLVAVRFARGQQLERDKLLAQVAAVGGSFALFLSFKFLTYGTLLPHAFALKTITRLYEPQPMALWEVWRDSAWALLLLGAAGLALLPRHIESVALVLYCCASTVSFVIGPSADWARYSAHMLPVVALLASVPLAKLTHAVPALAFAAFVLIISQSYGSFTELRSYIRMAAGHQACRQRIGEYLERTLAPGTPVLSSDIGAIAYAAPSIKFIDAVGLTSKDMLEPRAHGKSVDPVLLANNPTIIADTCKDPCATPEDFSTYGWLNNQAYWRTRLPDHLYSSWMQNGKLLEHCQSPDGYHFGVARFDVHVTEALPSR